MIMQGVIKQIFVDNWEKFSEIYKGKIRANISREVDKMINCKSLDNGFIEFKCENCGHIKRVGFSCKSRFCTSCGKKKSEEWSDEMVARLINSKHRHMVFTIPQELRIYFARDRKLLSLLPKCSAKAIMSWFRDLNKKECFTPGIISVIHTFGRDLKWNPHVHLIVTEGGAGEITIWRNTKHINYTALRKRWQKILLDEIGINLKSGKKEFKKLKNKLYKRLENGFYVYGKGEIKTAKQAGKYVGRYTARPAIAESRIIKYDGKKVTFRYERHEDGEEVVEEIDVIDFIGRVIRHIPEKNFKMIRYYGIYAKNTRHKNKFFKLVNEKVAEFKRKINNWQTRILLTFGVNPLKCEKCGTQMKFHDIYYKNVSVREKFKEKIIGENKIKIEEIMYNYGVIKGIIRDKIEPLYV
ncbi:transposase for insertion sequence element IS801 [Clostridium pasteurianum DSM 525 = ATCC 6013]|uniref:Transposase n=3 Tax=Clostridium pasteurianum TaxID=1501 RepID=A0A0H3J900_CLOPA|nr:transposase for insertion sequence element IS801 [Clostridium pasteurianum DSM 525 = ATCC 6013]AJA47048.1 transposase for insertion sequence element IS801 [Clostridium pasteurianum DSM 525 = ATCC 6013]AJA47608.1 transposase for insertion sequence element IS801 [Clostridium pasteurianum DSM 525 = ATCC 6013]AJA48473.1 transposase for insertion sequence element IS801 [Clostridium pasteurianum DSM 525 = ATCC 6013]AJA48587.1 transposase for insertion sequence element IS801 [Clostridium pasteurian